MKTEMTIEMLVTEVTMNLSHMFLSKLSQTGKDTLTQDEVIDLYVQALQDTARVYQTEHNNRSTSLQ